MALWRHCIRRWHSQSIPLIIWFQFRFHWSSFLYRRQAINWTNVGKDRWHHIVPPCHYVLSMKLGPFPIHLFELAFCWTDVRPCMVRYFPNDVVAQCKPIKTYTVLNINCFKLLCSVAIYTNAQHQSDSYLEVRSRVLDIRSTDERPILGEVRPIIIVGAFGIGLILPYLTLWSRLPANIAFMLRMEFNTVT